MAGLSLLAGRAWARIVAVVVAFVSAVGNIAFMSAQPFWSTLMIALDIIVIWAVMVHGGSCARSPTRPDSSPIRPAGSGTNRPPSPRVLTA